MRKSNLVFLALILITMSSVAKSKQRTEVTQKVKNEIMIQDDLNHKPLASQLNAQSEAFTKKAPAVVLKKYKEGLEDVSISGVLDKALKVGDKAVDFTLKNQKGEKVTLYQELKKGPVVLIWYRGGWCPYCNLTLRALQEELPNFKREGASLIALTPEVPDKSLTTTEKNDLEFTVLSDLGNKVGKKYGLIYKLTKDVAELYQKKFDLYAYNGDKSDELPLAATYIVDTDGIIKYAFLDADYKKRAEPSEIVKFLKTLN